MKNTTYLNQNKPAPFDEIVLVTNLIITLNNLYINDSDLYRNGLKCKRVLYKGTCDLVVVSDLSSVFFFILRNRKRQNVGF